MSCLETKRVRAITVWDFECYAIWLIKLTKYSVFVKMMRAVRFASIGGPEVLNIVSLPIPTPLPNHVRIRVKATGGKMTLKLVLSFAVLWNALINVIPLQ
jgi:hypothetical protein